MKSDVEHESAAGAFAALYDAHPEYIARRQLGSFQQAQVDIEVRRFKLPNLMRLLPVNLALNRIVEIGCATGELIAAVPAPNGARKIGVDISAENIAAAKARFPLIDFRSGDFRTMSVERCDVVIISDVLEHVPDDVQFLRDAAVLGNLVLVNIPLEDNWLNKDRNYGPNDISGHLRKYSLAEGLALVERAGMEVLASAQVWVHETPVDAARRALRREHYGAAFSGNLAGRFLRRVTLAIAVGIKPLGRRLFASNLFVAARLRRPS